MVTDFASESEPLRIQLRTLGLSLIAGTRRISGRSSEPHYALGSEVMSTIDEALVLMRLSTTIGLISEMNGTVLITELEKVKADIEHQYGAKKVLFSTHPGYANIVLSESMFEVAPVEPNLQFSDKGQASIKGQNVTPEAVTIHTPTPKSGKEFFSKKNDIGIKIARRNDVLNVVRSKGRASIKDVVSLLKDISEKTVQRELLALVKEGVLAKEGEKRWSTYRVTT
jgi:hypothetical protein